MYICILLFMLREFAWELKKPSSERLWLAIAFISPTHSCAIGYNVQHCKNLHKKINGQHF